MLTERLKAEILTHSMKQDLFSSHITRNPQPYQEITEFPDMGKDLYLTDGSFAFGDRLFTCITVLE